MKIPKILLYVIVILIAGCIVAMWFCCKNHCNHQRKECCKHNCKDSCKGKGNDSLNMFNNNLTDVPPGIPIKADGGGGCISYPRPIGNYHAYVICNTNNIPLVFSASIPARDNISDTIFGSSYRCGIIDYSHSYSPYTFNVTSTTTDPVVDPDIHGFHAMGYLHIINQDNSYQKILSANQSFHPNFPPKDNNFYIIDINYTGTTSPSLTITLNEEISNVPPGYSYPFPIKSKYVLCTDNKFNKTLVVYEPLKYGIINYSLTTTDNSGNISIAVYAMTIPPVPI